MLSLLPGIQPFCFLFVCLFLFAVFFVCFVFFGCLFDVVFSSFLVHFHLLNSNRSKSPPPPFFFFFKQKNIACLQLWSWHLLVLRWHVFRPYVIFAVDWVLNVTWINWLTSSVTVSSRLVVGIAHLVERLNRDWKVAGSIPGRGNFLSRVSFLCSLLFGVVPPPCYRGGT